MRRLMWVCCWVFSMVTAVHAQVAVETPRWTIADVIQPGSGLSVFRYSNTGLGAYPYYDQLPGVPLKVLFDGVPIRAFSPFGTDIDLFSVQYADSVSFDGSRVLNIHSDEVSDDVPVTSVNFLLGNRRRFRTTMSFRRALDERSGIVVSGASSGIHEGDNLEKASARNYFIKYYHDLQRSGRLVVWMRTFRDRDGLVDLMANTHMGERRTDGVTWYAALEKVRLSEHTTVTPKMYYNVVNTRIGRYGNRKTLDDDTIGFHLDLETMYNHVSYRLGLGHDRQMLDSRLHDISLNRDITTLNAAMNASCLGHVVSFSGNGSYSSEYDTGYMVSATLTKRFSRYGYTVQAYHEDVIPDTATEFYPALVFSDSTDVMQAEVYRVDTVSASLNMTHNLNLSVFASDYQYPRLEAIISALDNAPIDRSAYLSENTRIAGIRTTYACFMAGSTQYAMNINASYAHELGSDAEYPWPFPDMSASMVLTANRSFLGDKLMGAFFQRSRFLHYRAPGDNGHSGGYVFLDAGVSFQVKTLELFYTIENLTGEELLWFDTLGSLGRNGMWGCRWLFYD